jgi:hypothetical protein
MGSVNGIRFHYSELGTWTFMYLVHKVVIACVLAHLASCTVIRVGLCSFDNLITCFYVTLLCMILKLVIFFLFDEPSLGSKPSAVEEDFLQRAANLFLKVCTCFLRLETIYLNLLE